VKEFKIFIATKFPKITKNEGKLNRLVHIAVHLSKTKLSVKL
jgi:hypothetical protein